jgi:hypothetical protein
MADLRHWDTGVVDQIVPRSVVDAGDVAVTFDPAPEMFIWGGGGPTNDPRTDPYLSRNHEHVDRFNDDPDWWSWWLALGRPEADVGVTFEGRPGLRVTVNEARITFGRVRTPDTIPADPVAARELADRDMLEALARLVSKLALAPHSPLR